MTLPLPGEDCVVLENGWMTSKRLRGSEKCEIRAGHMAGQMMIPCLEIECGLKVCNSLAGLTNLN